VRKIITFCFCVFAIVSWSKETYTQEQVGVHNKSADCWLVVEGNVYNITDYLPKHEKYTISLPDYCGKDATEAWNTKGTKGEPHVKKAKLLLKKYFVGELIKSSS